MLGLGRCGILYRVPFGGRRTTLSLSRLQLGVLSRLWLTLLRLRLWWRCGGLLLFNTRYRNEVNSACEVRAALCVVLRPCLSIRVGICCAGVENIRRSTGNNTWLIFRLLILRLRLRLRLGLSLWLWLRLRLCLNLCRLLVCDCLLLCRCRDLLHRLLGLLLGISLRRNLGVL